MITRIFGEFHPGARSVREEVFINEQGFSYDYDETDDIAAHLVMFDNDTSIGACRVFESKNTGIYILGRLAVMKEYRKCGVGSALVEAAKKHALQSGGKELMLHSQLQAKDFYAKLGFSEFGGVEYEENCPHIWMKIALAE